MTFYLTCVYIIFSSVWVAVLSPFGKELLTRLTIFSLCILTICNFSNFPFWLLGWIWVLIASNKNIIIISFKSSGDIQKKEGGPDSCCG